MQTLSNFQDTYKNHIASLTKNKEFMSNVEELAKFQVLKPQNKKLTTKYNDDIEAQKGRIIIEAISQSITTNNGQYLQADAISSVNNKLLLAEHNQQINNFNKVGDIFSNSANSNKNELQKELDKLEQQEEAKAETTKEKLQTVLALPEVKEKYDECVGLVREDMRQNFDSMILRKCKGDITKDTVLAEIQGIKEKMGKIQKTNYLSAINRTLRHHFQMAKKVWKILMNVMLAMNHVQ